MTCPAVPCSFVHIWLYCVKTEARFKSLENADHITRAELFYLSVLKYVVFNFFFSPPNYLGKIFHTKKPIILPSNVAASASFLLPWSPSFTDSAQQMVMSITISGYFFPYKRCICCALWLLFFVCFIFSKHNLSGNNVLTHFERYNHVQSSSLYDAWLCNVPDHW